MREALNTLVTVIVDPTDSGAQVGHEVTECIACWLLFADSALLSLSDNGNNSHGNRKQTQNHR